MNKIKMKNVCNIKASEAFERFVISKQACGLTDILINRNEFGGFQIGGTGTHSGTALPTLTKKPSSTRKYICPCCGMSVRATRSVNIGCLDCDVPMVPAA